MNKETIFVSGPVMTKEYHTYYRNVITKLREGQVNVIAPIQTPSRQFESASECIIDGLTQLAECDTIVLLRDWDKSKICRLEKTFAETLNLNIMYYEYPI